MSRPRIHVLIVALAATWLPVVAGGTASAAPAAAVWHINGTKARYDAFDVSADGCQYRRLALSVVQNAQRDGASVGNQTVVSGLYLAFDNCDAKGGGGTFLDVYAQPVPSSAFTFDRDLSTAHLAARVDFSDDVVAPPEFGGGSGGNTVPLDLDLTWSATSDPLHFTGGQRFHGLRCGYTEHATGYFRGAALAGTVTGPDGSSYLPAHGDFADIGVEHVNDGIIEVGCPGAAAARVSQASATTAPAPSGTLDAFAVASQGSLAVAGPQAVAAWSRMDPDGCHRTSMVLVLSDQTVRDSGAPVEVPNVDGVGGIDDLCHPEGGAVAIFGFGYGGADATPGSIVIDRQLNTASAHFTVTGTVETIDSFDFVPVTIDVDWTGIGDPVRSTGGYRFRLAEPQAAGCFYVSNGTATQRAASATGAVSFGTLTSASGPADWALLQDVRQGEQGSMCY